MNKILTNSFIEKFVTDSGYIFTSMILVNFFLIVNSIMIARILGPEKLGILSIIQYLGGMIIMFSSLNLPTTATTFIAEYRVADKNKIGKTIGTISLISIISSSFILISTIISSDSIASFYNEPSISFLIKEYTLTIFFTMFSSLLISIIAGFQEMQKISKLNVILALIGVPISLIFVYYFNIYGAIFSLLINACISFLVALNIVLKLLKKEQIKIDFSVDRELIKKIAKYSAPLFVSGIAYASFQWFGPTLLSIGGNFSEVGVYKVALAIYTLIQFIPNAIRYNLMPTVSNLSSSEPEHLPLFVSKALKMIMILMLLMILVGNLVIKEIILVSFGSAYIDAVSVTYILIASSFFVSICSSLGAVFMGIKKTKVLMYLDICFCFLFIASSYILIKKLGLIGMASTYLVTYFILTLYFFYISRGIKLQYKLLRLPLIICVIFLILSFLISYLLSGVLFYTAGILLIIFALFIGWKLLDVNDKEIIYLMFGKFKSRFFTTVEV